MRRLLLKLLVVSLVAFAGSAVGRDIATARLASYELDNGLQVILLPDHKVPKVSVTILYHAGAVNEPVGRSGFAHLFEHLMYSGTPTYPSIDTTLSALGLVYNAETGEDETTYYATGMASTLPVILSVHADQMANIGQAVSLGDLDLQRSVVLNEMRQKVLDAPGGAAFTTLQAEMFPKGHPYGRAVIGSIGDLEAATIEDVRSFFNAYYAPSNAILVIVGDFEMGTAEALVEETFGRIARGAKLPAATASEVVPVAARLEVEDAVSTPTIYLGFSGPKASAGQDGALHIASDLLSNEAGPLRALVNEGVATYAAAFWMPGELAGRFFVIAGAGAGVSAEMLEARVRATIAGFVEAPIDTADFERSRSVFLLGVRAALEAFETRARYAASVMATTGDVSHVLEDDPDFAKATAESVERAVDQVLAIDAASVAIVRPGARGRFPTVLSDSSGEPEAIVAPVRHPVEIPVLAAGEPKPAALPVREVAALSNGIKVVHYRMTDAPLAYIAVAVSGGDNNDPRGKEGLYSLTVDMGGRGAGERDIEEFGRALRDIGGTIGTWVGMTASGAALAVRPENLGQGIELLADVVQKPRFDEEQWAVLKAGTLDYLVQRDANPADVVERALSRIVFFPGDDQSEMDWSVASVGRVTREEAAVTYETLFTPRTMVVYSVGDLSLETVTAALEQRFGAWQDDGAGIVSRAPLSPVFPDRQRVYLAPMPGASQATILISRPAPGYDDPDYAPATAVTNLLAGDFLSRLNSVIREQRGYSYGVSAHIWKRRPHDGGLTVTIPVQSDATGAALNEAFAGFGSLVSQSVTEGELNRSLMSYLSAQAGLPETAGGFFGALVGWEKDGVDLSDLVAFLRRMSELDLADVRAAAATLADLDRAVIIVAGDPDLILPQLAAIGITDVETIDITDSASPR